MYEHTQPFHLTKLAMAFAECLMAARVSALSFLLFFLLIFGQRSDVKETSESKKRRDRKQGTNKEEKETKKVT
jgi:hypothetical protein